MSESGHQPISRREFLGTIWGAANSVAAVAAYRAMFPPILQTGIEQFSITRIEDETLKHRAAFELGIQLGSGGIEDSPLLDVIEQSLLLDNSFRIVRIDENGNQVETQSSMEHFINLGYTQLEAQCILSGYYCSYWGIEDDPKLREKSFDVATQVEYLDFADMQERCGQNAGACVIDNQMVFPKSNWIQTYWHELTHILIEQKNIENTSHGVRITDQTTQASIHENVRFFSEGGSYRAALVFLEPDGNPGTVVNLNGLNEFLAEFFNKTTMVSTASNLDNTNQFLSHPAYIHDSPLVISTQKLMFAISNLYNSKDRELRKKMATAYIQGDYMALAEAMGEGLVGRTLDDASEVELTNPYAITLDLNLPQEVSSRQKKGLTILSTNAASAILTFYKSDTDPEAYLVVPEVSTQPPDPDIEYYPYISIFYVKDGPVDQSKLYYDLFDSVVAGEIPKDISEVLLNVFANHQFEGLPGNLRKIMAVLSGTLYRLLNSPNAGSAEQSAFYEICKEAIMNYRIGNVEEPEPVSAYYGIPYIDERPLFFGHPTGSIPNFLRQIINDISTENGTLTRISNNPTLDLFFSNNLMVGAVTPDPQFIATIYSLSVDNNEFSIQNFNINFAHATIPELIIDAVMRQFTQGRGLDSRFRSLLKGVQLPFLITNAENIAQYTDAIYYLLHYNYSINTTLLPIPFGLLLDEMGITLEQLRYEFSAHSLSIPENLVTKIIHSGAEYYAKGLLYLILLTYKIRRNEKMIDRTVYSEDAENKFITVQLSNPYGEQEMINAIKNEQATILNLLETVTVDNAD